MMKVIYFDVDDTLYVRSGPFIKTCEELLAPDIQLDWEEFFVLRNKYGDAMFERQIEEHISDEEMHIYRMEQSLAEYGLSMTKEEILHFEDRYLWHQGHIDLTEGYEQLFTQLVDKGSVLGIITNGTGYRQRNKIESLQVEQWIPQERWIVSGDIGCIKPDPRIFQAAITAAEQVTGPLKPEECVFVGDNYRMDICGARAAGWKTIWFPKKDAMMPEDKGASADAIARSVEELMAILLSK